MKKKNRRNGLLKTPLRVAIVGLIFFGLALLLFYFLEPTTRWQVALNAGMNYGFGLSLALIIYSLIRTEIQKAK